MQADRSAGAARLAGSVRGLGVCDVVRIELAAVQRAGLARRVGGLDRGARARRRTAAAGGAQTVPLPDDPELGEVAEQLRLFRRLRASVPEPGDARSCSRARPGWSPDSSPRGMTDALIDVVAWPGEAGGDSLAVVASDAQLEAAAAWIATALDCRAVESFCFEPERDPAHAW